MNSNLFFLSDFYHWGGAVSFTAHLLYTIGYNQILRIAKASERNATGPFGYGLCYKTVQPSFFDQCKSLFVTDFFKYEHILDKLKRDGVSIVIHDSGEISDESAGCLKKWNIICIRKAFQEYLKSTYDAKAEFLYHPFYPYPTENSSDARQSSNALGGNNEKNQSVSISRIDYGKNIEIIVKANKILQTKSCDTIKIYGPYNPLYVQHLLGGEDDFRRYYHGTFMKSFQAISKILNRAKFVIDLSTLPNDGGGTQYTFLEAIHHGAALIINRKWSENVSERFRDFKEGYNCFAVSNAEELAMLISNAKNIDTEKIVKNSKHLMSRHVNASWNSVVC